MYNALSPYLTSLFNLRGVNSHSDKHLLAHWTLDTRFAEKVRAMPFNIPWTLALEARFTGSTC